MFSGGKTLNGVDLRKWLLYGLLALSAVSIAIRAALPPQLQVSSDLIHLGVRQPSDIDRVNVSITNSGGRILYAQIGGGSCGCISPGRQQLALMPGESGQLPLDVRFSGLRDEFNGHIVVVSNDPIRPTLLVPIDATIAAQVQVRPRSVVLEMDETDSMLTGELYLDFSRCPSGRIESVAFHGGPISACIEPQGSNVYKICISSPESFTPSLLLVGTTVPAETLIAIPGTVEHSAITAHSGVGY